MSEAPPLLLAVLGRPVLASRSPALQEAGLRALGLPGSYLRLASPDVRSALRTARSLGLTGLNVTSPFKEEAARLADERDPLAERLGAANTLLLQGERVRAFNTDVHGVAAAFEGAGARLAGQRAVVLGAGGAARAAALALLQAGAEVTLANRTLARAQASAGALGLRAAPLEALAELLPGAAVLVGCLSTAERVVPPALLAPGLTVLEALYARPTALVEDARARGCTVVDGREWLLHQGARAFELFTGREAPLAAMREALAGPVPARPEGIALVGFMGSGKSATAAALGALTGRAVVELDGEIARAAGRSVAEIFAREGEAGFRARERQALLAALEGAPKILSCGGGAVLDPRNLEALRAGCTVVWLWASAQTVLARTAGDPTRPLLEGDREARVRTLLAARLGAYARAAQLVVDTDEAPPSEVARRVLDETG